MYRMATTPEYQLRWQTGEDKLLLISVGTGAAPAVDLDIVTDRNAVSNLAGLPSALMYGAMVDQDTICRTIGRCVAGPKLDREIGDLVSKAPVTEDQGRSMMYARYNADLSVDGLLPLGLGEIQSEAVLALDAVDRIDDLSRIGKAVAKQQVNLREQFGGKWMSLP
jgi:hypothetical protein